MKNRARRYEMHAIRSDDVLRAGPLAVALALLLAGCAAGPDYHAPVASMRGPYHGQVALEHFNQEHAQLPAPALDTWWNGFHDPVLETIVKRVLAQNLDLDAAMARVEQARAAARAAGARQLPSGTLSADALRQRQSTLSPEGRLASVTPGYDRHQTILDVGAGASWELDLAGGLRRGTESAVAESQAAEADQLGVRVSVTAEAADAYFQIRGAQQRIALAKAQLATNMKLFDLVTLRQSEGLGANRETAQAAARVAQVRATIAPLVIERDIQLNRLDVLMGAQPGTYASDLVDSNTAIRIPAIETAGGPAALLQRRPDVIAAERRLAASSARIGVAAAQYYPSVTLSALLGFASLGGGSFFTAAAFQPQAGAALRWRMFDFGRIDADVARAQGVQAEALAVYRKSMLHAVEDVENAVLTLVQLEAQTQDVHEQVAAQQRARDSAQEAYKGGAASLYEVLEEDRLLLDARDQQARIASDQARSAVASFRAMGGGW